MSDSLWPYGLQHTRPPCPSPTHGVYSNSCPLSRWCHPTISSSVVPFSSRRLQSFPASRSFLFLTLIFTLFYFTVLYWFCHTLTWIRHRCTWVPNPEPPSLKVFSNESVLHIRWPKYWSFSFNIRLSNEHPGLISFRMDWLDLLAGQGTLKSLLQHHSSKASILQCSTFFTVQLSHPYMTTGKTIALTKRTFVGK